MNKGRDSSTPDIEVNPGESEFNKIATSDEDYDLDNDFDVIEDWAEDEKQESTKKEDDVSQVKRDSPAIKGTLKSMMADQAGNGARRSLGNGPPNPEDDRSQNQQEINNSSSIQMMPDYDGYEMPLDDEKDGGDEEENYENDEFEEDNEQSAQAGSKSHSVSENK